MSIKVDDLVEAVRGELEEYAAEVTGATKEVVKEVVKSTVKVVKDKSPVRFGSYKKSWGQTTTYESAGSIQVTIHNKKRYMLTHLLENGHALRNGGRAKAYPHIKPAEDFAARELEKAVVIKIRK